VAPRPVPGDHRVRTGVAELTLSQVGPAQLSGRVGDLLEDGIQIEGRVDRPPDFGDHLGFPLPAPDLLLGMAPLGKVAHNGVKITRPP